MAMDYAIRFGLQARGWARGRRLVAEAGARMLKGTQAHFARIRLRNAVQRLQGTTFGAPQARACLDLASLETIYRAGYSTTIGQPRSAAQVRELEHLVSIVPWDWFEPTRELLLNPTFGDGSRGVGGADADLYLDGCVLELKTTQSAFFGLPIVRQLVGYAALAWRFGVDGATTRPDSIGVYFCRTGRWRMFELNEVVRDHEETLPALADFLVQAARP